MVVDVYKRQVPATELLWTLRAVKDQAELDCMIRAQRIAEKALADILGEIRPGVTEKANVVIISFFLGNVNLFPG